MGSMKSTHTMSLEVMFGVMSLKTRFEYLSLRIPIVLQFPFKYRYLDDRGN